MIYATKHILIEILVRLPCKNGDSFRGESAFWSLYIQEGGTEDGFLATA